MSSVQSFIISCAKIKVSFLIKEINQLQIQIWMASTGTLKLHTVDSRVNKHIYARSVHFLISICVIDVLTGVYYMHIRIYILHIFWKASQDNYVSMDNGQSHCLLQGESFAAKDTQVVGHVLSIRSFARIS